MTERSLPAHPQPKEEEVLILRPSRGWSALNLGDLWRFRELIYFMIWRDVKVRYKQTVLGAAWAIIQPFFTMVVFTIFFGRLGKIPSDNVPYPLFSYAGLLPWGLFTKALSDAGRSMISNRSMITKVYFPRLSIPIASVLAGLVDFAIAFVVLVGMLIYYNNLPAVPPAAPAVATPIVATLPAGAAAPLVATSEAAQAIVQAKRLDYQNAQATAQVAQATAQASAAQTGESTIPAGKRYHVVPRYGALWTLPLFLLLSLVTALGVGLWLSALNVIYRDINYALPFLVQFWLFVTPIAYPSSMITSPKLLLLYSLNPMAGVVEGFRWVLLGTETAPGPMVVVSTVIAILLLISGLFYFRRMERTFADQI